MHQHGRNGMEGIKILKVEISMMSVDENRDAHGIARVERCHNLSVQDKMLYKYLVKGFVN